MDQDRPKVGRANRSGWCFQHLERVLAGSEPHAIPREVLIWRRGKERSQQREEGWSTFDRAEPDQAPSHPATGINELRTNSQLPGEPPNCGIERLRCCD